MAANTIYWLVLSPVTQQSGGTYWKEWDHFIRKELLAGGLISPEDTALYHITQNAQEAVEHMAKSMREHVKAMHGDIEGNADTEKLRLVMRSFRQFIDSLDGRRAV